MAYTIVKTYDSIEGKFEKKSFLTEGAANVYYNRYYKQMKKHILFENECGFTFETRNNHRVNVCKSWKYVETPLNNNS